MNRDPSKECRLCQGALPNVPVFVLNRAPAGAQCFTRPGEPVQPPVTLRVMQCADCGLVQLEGPPVPYYRATITAAGLSDEMRAFRTQQFKSFLDENSLGGRLVAEVGSSRGLFTDLLADAGAHAIGIEGGLAAEREVSPKGHALLRGYPEFPDRLPEAPFAGFICINFLEHAPRPRSFLRSIACSLEPGAAGIVEVPALEHMLKANLSYDWVADHLSYFSRETLHAALAISGFEVVRTERVWHGYDWAATVIRRHDLKLDQMRRSLEDSVNGLRSFVCSRAQHGRPVAIWGASHQSLTLLTQCTFDTSEVPFIIDSAPFKQGTLAPGCQIPVCGPDTLMRSSVDCVLIMAGGFSREIGLQLRALGFRGEAAIYDGGADAGMVSL